MVLLGSDVGLGSRAGVNLTLTSYLIPSIFPKVVKLNEDLASLTAYTYFKAHASRPPQC